MSGYDAETGAERTLDLVHERTVKWDAHVQLATKYSFLLELPNDGANAGMRSCDRDGARTVHGGNFDTVQSRKRARVALAHPERSHRSRVFRHRLRSATPIDDARRLFEPECTARHRGRKLPDAVTHDGRSPHTTLAEESGEASLERKEARLCDFRLAHAGCLRVLPKLRTQSARLLGEPTKT